jgi:ribosomal protein L40E
MGVLDFVNGVTTGVSKKTKNVSESNNLKKKMLYERERITEIFTEIGEKFYNDQNGDHSELIALCENIDQRKRRIQKMNVEVNAIKGKKVCPKCRAKFDDDLDFCGKCGTKLIVLEGEE